MKVMILGSPRSGSTYLYNVVSKFYANSQARDKELYSARNELLYVDETYIIDTIKSFVDFTPQMTNHMTADVKKQYTENGFSDNNVAHMLKHIDIAAQHERVVFKDHILSLEHTHNVRPDIYTKFVNIVDYTILLLRRNIFEASLSAAIAYAKQDFTQYAYDTSSTIRFTKDEFLIAWYAHYINYKKLIKNDLGININEVVYYEDFKHKQPIDIYYNLDLCNKEYDDLPIFGSQVSKAPSKKDLVENYDELVEYAYELECDPRFADLNIKDHIIQVRY